MSLTRSFSWLSAFVAVVSLVGAAYAEHPQFQPFIEPDHFNPDLQFFAPAEVSEFGGGEPPNIGFYATYDRVHINVTRPEGAGPAESPLGPGLPPFPVGQPQVSAADGLGGLWSPWDGDMTWGNRFDFGYMTEDDVGWNAVAWHIDGPNVMLLTPQERIDRLNADDDPPDDPDPILQDRNPRIYDLKNSINLATVSSIEINRVWRRKEFHNGGVFEPMVGARFMKFDDFTRRDSYGRFLTGIDVLPDPGFPTGIGPAEVYSIDKTSWENNMLGGQLGFRLSKTYGHWLLSTEMRAFAMQNFQYFTAQRTSKTTVYNLPPGEGQDVRLELVDKDRIYFKGNEFVWGGEIRGEAAYEVTRDISLRVGFVFLDLGQGVARGNNPVFNSEDVQMGGVTFGLTMNR